MGSDIEQQKERAEEMRLAAMLWWQTIWYASEEGTKGIPSQQGWLSCELIAAIVKMTTGKQWWVSPCHDESGRIHLWNQGWQWWNLFNQALEDRTPFGEFGRWTRALEALADFVRYDRDGNSSLEWFHKNNALHNPGCSIFIPHQEAYRVSKRYLETSSGLGVWDQCAYDKVCKLLGEHMQPVIARDIAYIKKNYSW